MSHHRRVFFLFFICAAYSSPCQVNIKMPCKFDTPESNTVCYLKEKNYFTPAIKVLWWWLFNFENVSVSLFFFYWSNRHPKTGLAPSLTFHCIVFSRKNIENWMADAQWSFCVRSKMSGGNTVMHKRAGIHQGEIDVINRLFVSLDSVFRHPSLAI